MVTTTLRNTMHVLVEAGTPNPTTPEGEHYPFALLSDDESRVVFADNLHDIIGFIVGNDYIELDDPERELWERQKFAVTIVAQLSRTDASRPFPIYPEGLDEAIDAGITDEDFLTFLADCYDYADDVASGDILLSNAKFGPQFSRVFFAGLDDDRTWDYSFPFIGVSTDYLPHTHVAPPTGNVVLVDPTDELTLINSLLEVNAVLNERGLPPMVKFFRMDD